MTCQLCSTKYTYCPSCREFNNYPTWMNMFDKENCKNVYFAVSNYHFNKDINKAKEILNDCDLSEINLYSEKFQAQINEIIGITTRVEEPSVPIVLEEPKEEVVEVIEDIEDVIPEISDIEEDIKPKARRKSSYKRSEF